MLTEKSLCITLFFSRFSSFSHLLLFLSFYSHSTLSLSLCSEQFWNHGTFGSSANEVGQADWTSSQRIWADAKGSWQHWTFGGTELLEDTHGSLQQVRSSLVFFCEIMGHFFSLDFNVFGPKELSTDLQINWNLFFAASWNKWEVQEWKVWSLFWTTQNPGSSNTGKILWVRLIHFRSCPDLLTPVVGHITPALSQDFKLCCPPRQFWRSLICLHIKSKSLGQILWNQSGYGNKVVLI